ncbi:probable G-protein coupled receptor 139 [Rhincodon typus]|uniref:probable G-protein coupled receptor 139 n=1 Tax=Rhincodon typus TaxID=259920 RepID=UPI00202E2651|nr:probable G-protein coupled receptor 139 [Rhincodon typus]
MRYSVIYLIQDIYYPILAAVGVPTNMVTIAILSRGKCGLSKCITCYLVGMAVADLLVIISDPILSWIGAKYFPDSFLHITPVCSLTAVLASVATVVSVWLTVAFTFDRFVAICCEKLKRKYCTVKTAAVIVGTVNVLSCLESVPWYFTYQPLYIVDNIPWYCPYTSAFLFSSTWAAFEMFHYILTPCVPFLLILLLNVLTVRRIIVSSRVRQGLQGISKGENHKDPELQNRKKSIVLLFSISSSFILLWITRVVYNLYRRITIVRFYYSTNDPRLITDRVSVMLQALSSCTNTCIYVVTQSKFREELKNTVKYPLKSMFKLVKP